MTQTVVPTPDLTLITTALIDAAGNRWTINQYGQVACNGVADTTTANVIAITLLAGNIWQKAYDTSGTWGTSPMWWCKPIGGGQWGPQGGQTFSPLPPLPAQVTGVTAA
jgi:hypothetical protein